MNRSRLFRRAMRWLPLLAALVLAGCATRAADRAAAAASRAGRSSRKPAAAGPTRARRPRRSRAANGGRPSPTRCSTRWSSAPAATTPASSRPRRGWRRRARWLRSADADRSPQIGARRRRAAAAGRRRPAARARPSTLITAGVDLSYELDLFGRLARRQRRGRARRAGARGAAAEHAPAGAGRGRADLPRAARARRRARAGARDRRRPTATRCA